jgi:hypothetical protein
MAMVSLTTKQISELGTFLAFNALQAHIGVVRAPYGWSIDFLAKPASRHTVEICVRTRTIRNGRRAASWDVPSEYQTWDWLALVLLNADNLHEQHYYLIPREVALQIARTAKDGRRYVLSTSPEVRQFERNLSLSRTALRKQVSEVS